MNAPPASGGVGGVGDNPGYQMQQMQQHPGGIQYQQQQIQQHQMQYQLQQQHTQQLQMFWEQQMQEVARMDKDPKVGAADFKNHQLPLARIKKIMKSDEDVRMISAEAPVLFAKACEMFILELTLRSWIHSEENKRRTLQRNDIAAAITKTDIFDFLVDIVPRDDLKEEGMSVPRPDQQAAMPSGGDPMQGYMGGYGGMYQMPQQGQMMPGGGDQGMVVGGRPAMQMDPSMIAYGQQQRPAAGMQFMSMPQWQQGGQGS